MKAPVRHISIGPRLADGTLQPLGSPRTRHHAHTHFRLAQFCRRIGHDDIGVHGQFQPAAQRNSRQTAAITGKGQAAMEAQRVSV